MGIDIIMILLSIFAASVGLLGVLVGVAFYVGNKNKDYSKRWWQSDLLKIAGLTALCFYLSYLIWP